MINHAHLRFISSIWHNVNPGLINPDWLVVVVPPNNCTWLLKWYLSQINSLRLIDPGLTLITSLWLLIATSTGAVNRPAAIRHSCRTPTLSTWSFADLWSPVKKNTVEPYEHAETCFIQHNLNKKNMQLPNLADFPQFIR